MAFAIYSSTFFTASSVSPLLTLARTGTDSWRLDTHLSSQIVCRSQSEGGGRRVWRRRKLAKKDEMLQYKMERIPFLEEQDNRFDFVNDVAAEAKEYVESNRDEYGGSKKAIHHVISNRVNDSGFYRPDAYAESDPFRPAVNGGDSHHPHKNRTRSPNLPTLTRILSQPTEMALPAPQLQRFLAIQFNFTSNTKTAYRNQLTTSTGIRSRIPCRCSAIAINAPSSLSDVSGIRWGSASVQGRREEMEDDLVVRSDGLDGFSFAAVFDGHGGVYSVKDELYKECVTALQGGVLLNGDFNSIKKALAEAFEIADKKLLNWLEKIVDGNDESGSTATVMLIGNEVLFISHVGDSCVISNGRICGDIAVSRAFGDTRFKTKKNEFGSFLALNLKVVFNDDLVIASPDTFKVAFGSDAEFVLLASDGLWDYINSSDAVTFVRNQLRKHGDVQVACDALAQTALDKGSQDNVSIIIADLGHTEWQNLPVEQQNFLFEFGQALATVGVVSLGIWLSSQVSF
ncbi:Protein phosphatase 2C 57 [Hibiscus syriacus]|uniref:protein-serine/threonine phosphatase n=1 Tax=Hibiscus syriacus TaxID=106335 RepID=A0A6A2YW96_HIBSY|nr:Protein phosphatase 2C 57 [Hibiscus syriacus]